MSRIPSSTERFERLAVAHRFAVRLTDGRQIGSPSPEFRLVVKSASLERRLHRIPSPLVLGEAWIDGCLDIEGNLFAAVTAMHALDAGSSAALRTLGLFRTALRPWRNRARDIASHYDLPAAFYELFLDTRLAYTCAYYASATSTLDEAQEHKLDLVCRKLRLAAGERLLDLGCGWGPLAIWAAANYGARVHAVTLSVVQAAHAVEAVRRAGLSDRVDVRHLDCLRLPESGRYDKIAAVGLIEHLGRHAYHGFFAGVRDRLESGGLFLNHGITMRRRAGWSGGMEFLDRHVFPGLDLVDLPATLAAVERSGLEILDVESLRPHYARTTREWAERLWARREEAIALADERTWRTFVAYMAAASVAFERGWIGLAQIVARRADVRDDGMRPQLRSDIYD